MLKVPVAALSDLTYAYQMMDYEHHEIHEGKHYYISGFESLDTDDEIDFQLTTSDTSTWLHMTFDFQGTQNTELHVYEGADVDSDGVAITPINNNRNSSNTTSLTLIQRDGTVNSPGTDIYPSSVGVSGNPVSAKIGIAERNKEIILKQNTTYRFVFTSNGDGNILDFYGSWYEHAQS